MKEKSDLINYVYYKGGVNELEKLKLICEKIWNDFVVPRDAKISELEAWSIKQNSFIDKLGQENETLKSELDKAKHMLTEIDRSLYVGPDLQDNEIMLHYIGVASVIKEEIEDFLKDKK